MHSVWVCMWAAIRKTSTTVWALFSEEKDMNDAEFPLVDKICELYMLIQIHMHTHTHTHTQIDICNTWLALKSDQIKDCLLFYEKPRDSIQPLNMCHTVLFITGMMCWFDSTTWSWCPSSTNHKIQKPPFHTTRRFMGWRIWSSHWRPTRTNQGVLLCCLLFLYIYIHLDLCKKIHFLC